MVAGIAWNSRSQEVKSRFGLRRLGVLVAAFAGFGLGGDSASAEVAGSIRRPNVIVIMADDFGYECIGANGGTSYRTPNIDKLAAGGTRFTRCYVQPLCTPTRVQLMTGQYNIRNYVHFGTLLEDQTTFGHLFRDAGYATCIVGKWQLGHDFKLPKHFGFDEYCLWQLTRRPERYKNPGLEINGQAIDYKNGEYGPDIVNDYAIDFVARSKDKPFFLYYPMILTHSPYVPTPDSDAYDAAAGGNANAKPKRKGQKAAGGAGSEVGAGVNKNFHDMVEYTDKLVGKLTAKLDELGIRDNTLIVFIGDNGTGKGTISWMGDRKIVGGKGTTDESGMRVPLVVNMPGTVKAGQVRDDLVDSTDFLPTICAAAGIEIPAKLTIDGHNFWPQARGETGTPREWIYCWYAKDGGMKADFEFAMNHEFKVYRDGRLFDVRDGDHDDKPINRTQNDATTSAKVKQLQDVLDGFANARPARFNVITKRAPPVASE